MFALERAVLSYLLTIFMVFFISPMMAQTRIYLLIDLIAER